MDSKQLLNSFYGAKPQGITTIFCSNLKYSIKQYVKGEVKCHIKEDTLIVDIYSVNGTVFRYTHKNIMSEFVQGVSSSTFAHIIVKQYKRYILNLHFL